MHLIFAHCLFLVLEADVITNKIINHIITPLLIRSWSVAMHKQLSRITLWQRTYKNHPITQCDPKNLGNISHMALQKYFPKKIFRILIQILFSTWNRPARVGNMSLNYFAGITDAFTLRVLKYWLISSICYIFRKQLNNNPVRKWRYVQQRC